MKKGHLLKKVAVCMLVFITAFGAILSPICSSHVKAKKKSITQKEAVAWIKQQKGTADDYDGVYGVQCVDLIKKYFHYFGVKPMTGYAYQYSTKSIPSGFKRYKKGKFDSIQAGDILIWGKYVLSKYSEYGHVGIAVTGGKGEFKFMDYNGGFHNDPGTIRKGKFSKVTAVIRPTFAKESDKTVKVAFSSYKEHSWADTTNASIARTIQLTNATPQDISNIGVTLFDSGENAIAGTSGTYKEESGNTVYVWFEANSDLGVTLEPGTQYYYQFYAEVKGKIFTNQKLSFTTKSKAETNSSVQNNQNQGTSSSEADVKPEVAFSAYKAHSWAETKNASMARTIKLTNASPADISKIGLNLYDTKGNVVGYAEGLPKEVSGNTAYVWFEANSDMGVVLKPGTKYSYQFSAVVKGETFTNKKLYFTTSK